MALHIRTSPTNLFSYHQNPNPKSKPLNNLSFPLHLSLTTKQLGFHTSIVNYNNSSRSYDDEDQQEVSSIAYPKPSEIPWSKELSNSVNLIGNIGAPVEIKHLSSGKVLAWTRLGVKKSASDTSWINLTFWDELAHIASQHLETGSRVYVSGRLVADTVESDEDEKPKIYYKVVVQQINFVEKSYVPVSLYERETNSTSTGNFIICRKIGKNYPDKTGASTQELWQIFFANPLEWWDNRTTKRTPKYPDFKHKDTGEALWVDANRPFTPASTACKTSWDPIVSLTLSHPTLVLLEQCQSRVHFKQILAQMIRNHLTGETFPMSRLLFFSAISHPENLDMAVLLYDHYTPKPNLYIYKTMISALSFSSTQSFIIYRSMLRSFVYPDKHTLLYILKASRFLSEGKQIHTHAIVTGLLIDGYLQNSLIKMYSEYGHMDHALEVFQNMYLRDTVSYNIMIVGYARKGFSFEALELFHEMVGAGVAPDEFTMVGLLISYGQFGELRQGKSIHAWIERRRSISGCNMILANTLLDMYVKREELKLAQRIFDAFVDRDIVSWNIMIAGYTKLGKLEVAQTIFDEMGTRDTVSWNSLMTGYAQKGNLPALVNLFEGMIAEDVRPDKVTIVTLISASAEAGALEQGRWIHGWVLKNHMSLDAFVGSALMDMYSKCGSIERALAVFNSASTRDVTVWTAMIAGFAFHGYGRSALNLFKEMLGHLSPNYVTFVAILTACSHSGMVEQGLKIFNSMREKYGMEPGIEHYGCLVDLLSRAGRLFEAEDVIKKMPMKPSGAIWGALLNVSKAHRNMEMAETALRELLKLEPEKEGGYVLLSNVYADCGRWSYSYKIREIMESRGVKKTAGWSSLVIDGNVNEFMAADKRHPSLMMYLHSMDAGFSYGTDDGTFRDAFATHGEVLEGMIDFSFLPHSLLFQAAPFPAPASAPDFNGYKGARDIIKDDTVTIHDRKGGVFAALDKSSLCPKTKRGWDAIWVPRESHMNGQFWKFKF
ncbi:hypothetical protein GIB67_027118 [Kingdonia uniflora]|uniref:Pentatricopeptide repeat-containing protein n=1 Tax=Kingdonia uniflora TaxID=39325 RepID=A0A7J7P277_9MAGN|nr:hypothetical protein GIB67_027118 [Kingdonia uniflora]